jgi:hypothetical protein
MASAQADVDQRGRQRQLQGVANGFPQVLRLEEVDVVLKHPALRRLEGQQQAVGKGVDKKHHHQRGRRRHQHHGRVERRPRAAPCGGRVMALISGFSRA